MNVYTFVFALGFAKATQAHSSPSSRSGQNVRVLENQGGQLGLSPSPRHGPAAAASVPAFELPPAALPAEQPARPAEESEGPSELLQRWYNTYSGGRAPPRLAEERRCECIKETDGERCKITSSSGWTEASFPLRLNQNFCAFHHENKVWANEIRAKEKDEKLAWAKNNPPPELDAATAEAFAAARWLYWDTETTNLFSPIRAPPERQVAPAVVTIGWTSDRNGPIIEGEVVIMPDREIEPEASVVHGFTKESLARDARTGTLRQGLEKFFAEIASLNAPVVLAAHNSKQFDARVIAAEMEAVGLALPPNVIGFFDTLPWTRKVYPQSTGPSGNRSHKLEDLCPQLGVKDDREVHGAVADSRLLKSVIEALSGRPYNHKKPLTYFESTAQWQFRTAPGIGYRSEKWAPAYLASRPGGSATSDRSTTAASMKAQGGRDAAFQPWQSPGPKDFRQQGATGARSAGFVSPVTVSTRNISPVPTFAPVSGYVSTPKKDGNKRAREEESPAASSWMQMPGAASSWGHPGYATQDRAEQERRAADQERRTRSRTESGATGSSIHSGPGSLSMLHRVREGYMPQTQEELQALLTEHQMLTAFQASLGPAPPAHAHPLFSHGVPASTLSPYAHHMQQIQSMYPHLPFNPYHMGHMSLPAAAAAAAYPYPHGIPPHILQSLQGFPGMQEPAEPKEEKRGWLDTLFCKRRRITQKRPGPY